MGWREVEEVCVAQVKGKVGVTMVMEEVTPSKMGWEMVGEVEALATTEGLEDCWSEGVHPQE